MNNFGVDWVIGNNLTKFREMPREPFTKSHTESVNVLIHGLNNRICLNDRFILSINIMWHLDSWEWMCKTKLSLLNSLVINLLWEFCEMSSNSSDKFCNGSISRTCVPWFFTDGSSKSLITDSKHEFLLLLGLYFRQIWL